MRADIADGAGGTVAGASTARPTFFARSALVLAAIVLLSFPLTYYLPLLMPAAAGARRFDTLHHLHALAFFAWIALYVWQTQLVARGRIARHREIGLAGFALSGAVIVLGVWMAQRAAQRRFGTMAHPYEFSWFNLIDIGLFALFMIGAILLVTRHKEWHRRFTFAAALCLVAPAATRWTLKVPGIDPYILDITAYFIVYPFLIALLLFDRRTLGRFHPATLTAIALLLPVHLSSAGIARSAWWNAAAPALIGPPPALIGAPAASQKTP